MRHRRALVRVVLVAGTALTGCLLVLLAIGIRDRQAGDRFDLVRWEVDTFPNRWVTVLGRPFRDDPDADEVIAAYFALPSGDPARVALENDVERIIEGRIDRVLAELGLSARIALPGTVFPPVDIELAISPQVLVVSPRSVIERESTALLRPDIATDAALAIEAAAEVSDRSMSALVVPSGGVATYPAIVSERSSYRGVLNTAAHEWAHHYLTFYPLGFNYFRTADLRAINETVADLLGDEVSLLVLERWGDPTSPPASASPTATPAATAAATEPEPPPLDSSAVLRALRLEVDDLLEEGRVEEAERRMEEVRVELADRGFVLRRINQAFFAWYGTYAARADATDPLGDQLREIRERTASLSGFLEAVRGAGSRADVEAILEGLQVEAGEGGGS